MTTAAPRRARTTLWGWILLALYLVLTGALGAVWFFNHSMFPMSIAAGVAFVSPLVLLWSAGTQQLCRPVHKRRWWLPVTMAGALCTMVLGTFVMAMGELWRFVPFNDGGGIPLLLIVLALNWIFWSLVLWRYTRYSDRFVALARLAKALFAGSLAELLALIPAHMVIARRPGCLVGLWTAMAIVAGLCVMCWSFGPATLLLILRDRHQRDLIAPICRHCGYDLRGSLAASTTCPECGAAIPAALRAAFSHA